MKISNKSRLKLGKIVFVTITWILVGLFKGAYDNIIISSSVSEGFNPDYRFGANLLFNALGGFLGGVIGGSILLYFLFDRLRKLSFSLNIILNGLFVIIIVFLVSLLVSIFYNSFHLGKFPWERQVWENVISFVPSPTMLSNLILWSLVVVLTQFVLQVNDNLGQGVLRNLVLGKYHRPQQEQRIFMFLDIKSSTTIAEKLGNVEYFRLLNDFFYDITDPILQHRGEIYQYVGDEVVISWIFRNGMKQADCLDCFFHIEDKIREEAPNYERKFGLIPEFKAGIHCGGVTVGEIGVIKKDITYSGDVLNTTSRIQEQCNFYQSNLLVSRDLLDSIPLNGEYNTKTVGELDLRGKRKRIAVSKVERNLKAIGI